MSPFTVEVLQDEPIILVTLNEEFKVGDHIHLSDAATREILDKTDISYYNILDTTRWNISFDQILQGANTGARGVDPIWKHPQICQTIFITQSKAIMIAVNGLRSATFGNIHAVVYETLEEGLAWCREQTQETASK